MPFTTSHVRASAFVAVLAAYLLPFVSVQGAGIDLHQTGVQMLIGSASGADASAGAGDVFHSGAARLATAALALAVSGLVMALVNVPWSRSVLMTFGTMMTMALVLLADGIDGRVRAIGAGAWSLELGAGFWLALGACVVGTIIAFVTVEARGPQDRHVPADVTGSRVPRGTSRVHERMRRSDSLTPRTRPWARTAPIE